MVTVLLRADAEGIRRAAAVLRDGGLVAFPTETVYGLGARADDEGAVRRIYAAKGRPATNPSIVHVASVEDAERVGAMGAAARVLAAAFWPGPLTLVLDRRPGAVADAVTAGGSTVAVRVPDDAVALALLREVGLPLAAPSANRSTHVSPTRPEHVLRSLGGLVDVVLDGGPAARGIESTIVDPRGEDPLRLLRPGALPAAAIAIAAAPRTVVDPGHRLDAPWEVAIAPGSQARHYAPAAAVVVVDRAAVEAAVHQHQARQFRVGVVAAGSATGVPCALEIVLADDATGYASGIYAALHDLEAAGCQAIVVERVPDDGAWAAVRDRLRRASVPAPTP